MKEKLTRTLVLIFGMFLLAFQVSISEMVETEYHEYTGTDGKKYVVLYYLDDISGDKLSEIKVEGCEDSYWKNGYIMPNYSNKGVTNAGIDVTRKLDIKPLKCEGKDFEHVSSLGKAYEPETFKPASGKVKVYIHKNLLDMNLTVDNLLEIKVADDSKIDIVDLSTGKVLASDVTVKAGEYQKLDFLAKSNLDKKRPYGVVVKQNGEILKTEIFYLN